MGKLLDSLSQIPECIPAQAGMGTGQSLRGQLLAINSRASARHGHTDDSLSADDYAYAKTQDWGKSLQHFGSYASFQSQLKKFIDREMLDTPYCRCPGRVIRSPEGTAQCAEATPPPKEESPRSPKPRKSPPRDPNPDPPLPKATGPALGEETWWNANRPDGTSGLPQPRDTVSAALPKPDRSYGSHSIAFHAAKSRICLLSAHFRKKVLNIALRQTRERGGLKAKHVDVVFAVDNSGSMEMAVEMVRDSVHQVVSALKSRGVKEVRFGLVTFNDRNNVNVLMDLTSMTAESLDQLRNHLNNLSFTGGQEPIGTATAKALSLLKPVDKPAAYARQVIVISDRDGLQDGRGFQTHMNDMMRQGSRGGIAVNLYLVDNDSKKLPQPPPYLAPFPQLQGLYQFLSNPKRYFQYNQAPKAWGSRP